MSISRNVSIAVVCGVFLFGVATPRALASYMVPDDWGTISARNMNEANLICTGTILSSQKLEGAESWWNNERTGPDIEAHVAEFQVDTVIRGADDLAGKKIQVQFAGSNADRPTFATEMKNSRCIICASKNGEDAFRLMHSDSGSFAFAGVKPDVADWPKMTFEQRMCREIVSAMASTEPYVPVRTLIMAGKLGLAENELIDAMVKMRDGEKADMSLQATLALIHLGHEETLLGMDEIIAQWKAKGKNISSQAGEALMLARRPETLPLLVHLLSSKDDKIRAGAAFSLRFSFSPKAVAALVSVLDDPNVDVRFSAVNGLGRLVTEHQDWLPNIDEFKKDPDVWTGRWKAWWEQDGQGKFPSVAEVLKENPTLLKRLQ